MPHRPWAILAALAICPLLLACSSAPPTWQSDASFTDARNNFKAPDFKGCVEESGQGSQGKFGRVAAPTSNCAANGAVTALADANKQMAEAYAIGAKTSAGQSHSGSYYKMRSDYYNTARSFLMDGMQGTWINGPSWAQPRC